MITKLLNELNEKNQELNELLSNKDYFKNLEERIEEVNKRNESLKDEVMTMRKLYFEIRDKNNKAIEYIENDDNYEEGYCDGRLMKYKDDLKPLLDILKGVDK